ncbi:TonB-dependent receptor [Chitinophaga japonensis]|nr:TonB-dependent receptor [Chitinophaga japonensis]
MRIYLGFLPVMLIASRPAFSQEDTTRRDTILKKDTQLKEVIVSASRREETLDEVPSSVTILKAGDLAVQKSINNNLSDILANTVPGLGFNSNRSNNVGQTLRGRTVLVMIDGIPQSTPLRNGARDIRTIDPGVLERVEVIKGATAIYGNGATGGLINYITKRPATDKAISGQTSLGANTAFKSAQHTGGWHVGQLLSGTIKQFDYIVSGRYEQTGVLKDARGQVLSPDYGLNELQMWNAYARLGYNINARNRVELMYNYFSSKQRTDYVVKAGKYGNTDSATTGIPGARPGEPEGTPYNHNASLRYTSQGLIGGTDLDVNLYLQDFNTIIAYSNFFEHNGQPAIIGKKKGLRINFNSPFTISSQWNGSLLYGLDVLADKTSQVLTDGRVPVPEMSMRNLAPYLQVKSVFLQHLVFKAGARFENIKIEVPTYTTVNTLNYSTGEYTGGGVTVNGGSLSYNTFVFNAGLRYNRLPYFKPFISFSQGFSVPELGLILRGARENTLANIETEAITTNNYEAGFSSSIGKLSLEGAAYISTSNLGASYVMVNGKYEVARSPEKVYGFEVAADYALLQCLSLGGSWSYTEGKREVNDQKVYLGGDRINPPKVTAYINYTPLSHWMVRLQMLHAGNRKRFDPVNGRYSYGTGPMNAFTIFNLFTSYEPDSHSSFRVGVENLFNKDYFTIPSQWQADNLAYVKGNGARINLGYTYRF